MRWGLFQINLYYNYIFRYCETFIIVNKVGLSYFVCIQSEYDRKFVHAFNLEMGVCASIGTYTVIR